MLRLVTVSLFAGALLAATPAVAQEAGPGGNEFCSKDLQPLADQRGKLATILQGINKRPKPKTFEQYKKTFNDFCSTMGSYIEVDRKMLAYMTTNKDFCSITDETIQGLTTDMNRNQQSRTKICSHPPRKPAPPPAGGGGGPAAPKPPVNLRLQ
jgi:hypothetical protein